MRVCSRSVALVVLTGIALAPAASAQPQEPKFEYAEPEEVEGVVWKLQTKAGLILSTGNSQSASLAAGASTSRKERANRFTGEASISYASSTLLLANDANGNQLIDDGEIDAVSQTTSQAWLLKARYDRFFGDFNSAFVTAQASSDPFAGKEIIGGGQLGYSRVLHQSDRTETAVEAGYDFQYEKYVTVDAPASIHSARAAVIHSTKITDTSLVAASLVGLVNLNEERAPNPDGSATVPPLQDWRINASASLTSSLTQRIGFGFTFKLTYDRVPAPRPPFAIPYAPGFQPFAERLDTVTEASLIITLL